MDSIMIWLHGKKAYLTAVAAILGVIAAWASGEVSNKEAIFAVVVAIEAIFLRAGIAKSGPVMNGKTPLFWLAPLGLSLVLTQGCVGTQPMSNSQQYKIASVTVRAAVDSIKTAGQNKLISDEDIVAIDPFVKQAFDSLRSMRLAVLNKDPIKCQWYLLQVQQLVAKLGTMERSAKEMK